MANADCIEKKADGMEPEEVLRKINYWTSRGKTISFFKDADRRLIMRICSSLD
jgi:hypothetical protein